jgi:uncharacterized repeat protein (TIGR03803 family)
MPRRSRSLAPLAWVSICLLIAVSALPAASQESIIYSFAGGTSDGAIPSSSLIVDKAGNLYGTTPHGGANGCGTVYQLSPQANGDWTETVLYSFTKQASGCAGIPGPSLVLDGQGNLYSTALGGAHGAGFVYELSPSSSGWTLTDLYDFHPTYTYRDGFYPYAGVIRDHAGNLYGTTYLGGVGQCGNSEGVVGGSKATGSKPPKGNTSSGCVIIFELSPSSSGTWTEKILYNFRAGADGAGPWANLTLDASGNLFGTTSGGGTGYGGCIGVYIGGCGTVFELMRVHGGWKEQVLYAFTGGTDGGVPVASVIFDKAGNLYGTTPGEFAEYGSVYELSPTATGTWTETTLSSFVDETYGFGAASSLIIDGSGNLYGTTEYGSGPTSTAQLSSNERSAPPPKPFGPGTIFEITPGQSGTWTTNWLHTFSGTPDGLSPSAGMVRGPDGALYGTTTYGGTFEYGAVYKFVP